MAEIPLADFYEAYAQRKSSSELSKDTLKAVRACSSRAEVRAILAEVPAKQTRSPKTTAKQEKKVEKNDDKKQ